MPHTKTHRDYVKEIKERPIEVIGIYTNNHTKIDHKCRTCSHVWNVKPNSISNGQGCPKCAVVSRINKLRRPNKVLEDHGDWVLIDISLPSCPSATSKMDRVDFDSVEQTIKLNMHRGYPMVNIGKSSKFVHRLFNPCWVETDHINRDRTDNRRCNLRECTRQENARNKNISCTNKSGYSGVTWCKQTSKWRVSFENKTIGRYDNVDEAGRIRRRLELDNWGEFCPKREVA